MIIAGFEDIPKTRSEGSFLPAMLDVVRLKGTNFKIVLYCKLCTHISIINRRELR